LDELNPQVHSRRTSSETQRIILDAAVELIEEGGPANLKVVDVARKSGIPEVFIYRYFSDRRGLLTAALVDLWTRYMEEPLTNARKIITDLPVEAFTPALLVELGIRPSRETERRRRWARLQVLAASPENPKLAELIKQTQTRINREQEDLIALIQERMPGHHVMPPRLMRMLNQAVSFGFIMEDMIDDPITEKELDAFLLDFFTRVIETPSD
jgi:AcrR family transcriptional regulator